MHDNFDVELQDYYINIQHGPRPADSWQFNAQRKFVDSVAETSNANDESGDEVLREEQAKITRHKERRAEVLVWVSPLHG
jgi:hypothetical protein